MAPTLSLTPSNGLQAHSIAVNTHTAENIRSAKAGRVSIAENRQRGRHSPATKSEKGKQTVAACDLRVSYSAAQPAEPN